ncbi:hypothetical protein ACVCL3_00975 [Rhodanobacter sp. UC4437_H4]|jgi:YD repeat-containing protein
MHTTQLAGLLLIAGLLCACSADKPGAATAGSDNRAAATAATPSGDASAEDVAAAARGDVDCPADAAPNAARTPVDDIVGVRPGMSYEQAANAVMCSGPLLVIKPENSRGFEISTFGQTVRQGFSARFAEPRVHKSGRQIMQEMQRDAMARGMNARRQDMQPGQSKWFVATMGMPGHEKAISVAREQWFEQDRNPTVDSVEQALLAKYGASTERSDQGDTHQLRWAYDPRGRLITETSPLFNRCHGAADPDSGVSLSADCGVVVAANVIPLRSNPALAQYLQVGVVDQAGGYQALTDTQQGLRAMDAERRAQQVRDAGKNAQAPEL